MKNNESNNMWFMFFEKHKKLQHSSEKYDILYNLQNAKERKNNNRKSWLYVVSLASYMLKNT